MEDLAIHLKDEQGGPVSGAQVLAAYPSRIQIDGRTDADGECKLRLYRSDLKMQILVAAAGFKPRLEDVVPASANGSVEFELELAEDCTKAMLFAQSTWYLEGIEGRFNPIRDPNGRRYVYADNIAINGKVASPAPVEIDQELELIDIYGAEATIRFLALEEGFSLIEYAEPLPARVGE